MFGIPLNLNWYTKFSKSRNMTEFSDFSKIKKWNEEIMIPKNGTYFDSE